MDKQTSQDQPLPARDPNLDRDRRNLDGYAPQHFAWRQDGAVGLITLNRPERKNPLTFESYAELRDLFRQLTQVAAVRVIVLQGAGGNFCSGGDVHEIIGPLTQMSMPELLAFTRMTGDLVKAMRACPQPIIAAIDGVCAGAGAILAMASAPVRLTNLWCSMCKRPSRAASRPWWALRRSMPTILMKRKGRPHG